MRIEATLDNAGAGARASRGAGRARWLCAALCTALLACARTTPDWVSDLDDPDPFVRRLAAVALGECSDADADLAARGLVRHLMDRDPAVYEAVLGSLERTAPRALPALFAELDLQRVTDPARSNAVHEILRRERTRILAAMPSAMETLPAERARALELWLSPLRPDDVPPLAPWFAHGDPRVRIAAARLCGTLHQGSAPAIDELSRALDDPVAEVRKAAAENLCEFDFGDAHTAEALARARAHADPVVARLVVVSHAASRLARLREEGAPDAGGARADLERICREERGLLIADLEHPRPRIRRLALHVLMAFAGAHESKAAGGDPELATGSAVHGLCTPPSASEIGALTSALASSDANARARAAFDLGLAIDELPSASAEALMPALIARVDDEAPRVRICAALALAELESRARAAMPALQRMLGEDSPLLRRVAEYAMRAVAID